MFWDKHYLHLAGISESIDLEGGSKRFLKILLCRYVLQFKDSYYRKWLQDLQQLELSWLALFQYVNKDCFIFILTIYASILVYFPLLIVPISVLGGDSKQAQLQSPSLTIREDTAASKASGSTHQGSLHIPWREEWEARLSIRVHFSLFAEGDKIKLCKRNIRWCNAANIPELSG